MDSGDHCNKGSEFALYIKSALSRDIDVRLKSTQDFLCLYPLIKGFVMDDIIRIVLKDSDVCDIHSALLVDRAAIPSYWKALPRKGA
ncbi:4015_t:CDS:2 [Diversispora eburnea]|uniref:4015_t:CDS:1 n=1 Tax=Diversispora eburnea TaxID=1213867 RepID=A0A9N9G985_9GLOM|nr:4015_t:CDS:2 [Diversispora eburnea]